VTRVQEVELLAREVAILEERLSVLERCLDAHHAIAATPEDVLSYHDPRRCPICAVAEREPA
jgi:hypothetical protein